MPIRTYKTIARSTVIATAIGFAALSLGGHAFADDDVVLDTPIGVGGCPNSPPRPCGKPITVPFTTTRQDVIFVNLIKNPNSECPDFDFNRDFKGGELPPGNHTITVDAVCPNGTMTSWGAEIQIVARGGPVGSGSAAQPKQGPTVSPHPGVGGVTFHITDRSGVASQCTYSSEGFESGFGLPANGSFDLFVPAAPLLKNRTGKVTCDNGTSTDTSVFY
jgi:hypothetical protein